MVVVVELMVVGTSSSITFQAHIMVPTTCWVSPSQLATTLCTPQVSTAWGWNSQRITFHNISILHLKASYPLEMGVRIIGLLLINPQTEVLLYLAQMGCTRYGSIVFVAKFLYVLLVSIFNSHFNSIITYFMYIY